MVVYCMFSQCGHTTITVCQCPSVFFWVAMSVHFHQHRTYHKSRMEPYILQLSSWGKTHLTLSHCKQRRGRPWYKATIICTRKCKKLWGQAWASWCGNMSLMSDVTSSKFFFVQCKLTQSKSTLISFTDHIYRPSHFNFRKTSKQLERLSF